MRSLVFAILIVGLVHCSSAPKNQPPETAQPESQVTTVAPPIAVSPDLQKFTCMKGGETRALEVAKKDAGCELNYSKSGKSSVVASSSHGVKHCVNSRDKIRDKLTKAGYACKGD